MPSILPLKVHTSLLSPALRTVWQWSVCCSFFWDPAGCKDSWPLNRLAFSALAIYGLATVAVLIATAISGFVLPDILRLMSHDVPAAASQWRITIASIFQINQTFSRIYSIAGAAAITHWSICCLRLNRLSRGFALYGCVIAPLIALPILIGHLHLDVHGMTVVMLTQVI